MLANAFPRSPWSLPGRLGHWELRPSISLIVSAVLRSSSLSPLSSPPLASPLLAVARTVTSGLCVFCMCVCVCILKEAGVERMYYYSQRQGVTGIRTMSPAGRSDLAARVGKTQRRSSSLRRETLISPSESPQKAQKHVPRYMHTCTGPGALALANLQDQQGPARAARVGEHVQDPQYTIVGASQQPWKQRHPQRGRELPALPDPPRICICHTFLGALPAFLFRPGLPGTRAPRNCPPFLSLLLWLQPESLGTEDDTTRQKQTGTGLRNDTERYNQFSTVRLRRLSRLSLITKHP